MKLLAVAFVSLLTKTCTVHQGGGSLGQKFPFWGTIFSLKIGVLLGKYFRKQTNNQSVYMIAKYLNQFFSRPPLMVPVHCHLQRGGAFVTRLKNRHFWTHFFLTITPKYLLHPETGCKYFTLCEPFHPLKSAGTRYIFACQSNENVYLRQNSKFFATFVCRCRSFK